MLSSRAAPIARNRGQRSVIDLVELCPSWTTRRESRAPFRLRARLRAAALNRSRTIVMPAARAVARPVAATADLPRRPIRLAGTEPVIAILPGPLTLTLTATPRVEASAFALTFAGTVRTGRAGFASEPVGVGGGGSGRDPGSAGGTGVGDGSADLGGGRNFVTSAPPIAGCSPVAETKTGALLMTHGSALVVGVPATLSPSPSFHAILAASCESDAPTATPAAATKQSTAAGNAGAASTPCVERRLTFPTVCVSPL